MAEIAPTYRHALRVWWSFTWRSMLILLAVSIPLGTLLILLLRPGPGTADTLLTLIMLPTGLWTQLWAMRKVLNMDYKKFGVRVVEREAPPETRP